MSDREVPETRTGAEPADEDIPVHSRGGSIDEPQPSAPPREDLASPDDDSGDADAETGSPRV